MKTKETLKRIVGYISPYKGYVALSLISAILSVAATLAAPVCIGKAIDYIIGPGTVDFATVGKYIALIGGTIAVGGIFQWTLSLATNKLAFLAVNEMRKQLFAHIDRLPLSYIDSHAHGDLITRMASDIEQISNGILQGFSQLLTGVFTIAGTLGIMLAIQWQVALVVIVITPLSLFVATFVAKHSNAMFRKQSDTQGKLGGYSEEMLEGQRIVAAFGYEEEAQKTFEEIDAVLYKYGVKSQFYSSLTNPCTRFVNNLVYAAVGIIGAVIAILYGTMSAGTLSTFLIYANQYTKPFNEITGVITELQTAFACARRVFAVLDEPEESPDDDLPEIEECLGTVEFDDVCFGYSPDKPLLQHIDVKADKGKKIAIVGPTGCGKTTLINLLMRFYDVDSGEIRVSDAPVKSVKRNSLRGQFGMVLQDTWLFEGTVRDNIAYGRRDATDEEVIAAAQAAHAHRFISKLADGYDTVITESGGNLSQGQRQLLCIARIMLTHPPMLILDEATSNIDTRTEIRIQKAFAEIMKGRTSFIIAHRLSTIRDADLILVMKDGNIIEQGTHEQLLDKGGFYKELYESQFKRSAF